ncbi:hypothetical protein BTH95_02345 [Lactobacillus delbrueckii subsp. bulgaricus]|nr:hypothetical protein [Lactobacillus delbrueckii subsp. bulgaricus]MBT8815657.1 hypothetical protein [Lactobacillus delbrueckii subsp. bulgaricus]MBT8840964.1 hypothetical protein [Lactobacillus delbrueckii subsp. bulgaricus]MBT8861591.1 hypothetical protein [Lactobacillus delbrueckii subsp. bulgaricus]MBT8863055.1 hypothetical protein [Lactobacillus delbrueckii subsp. bulgaricus]
MMNRSRKNVEKSIIAFLMLLPVILVFLHIYVQKIKKENLINEDFIRKNKYRYIIELLRNICYNLKL